MQTSVWLPTGRAQLALTRGDPVGAIKNLQVTRPREGGLERCLYPVYVRGQAYLAAKDLNAAATEFQTIIDHSGIAWSCVPGPLARLGLARAYALQRDAANSRKWYEDFFSFWKDADPEIPILRQAKAEYAKLE